MHFSKKLIIAAVATIAPAVIQAATVTSNPSLSVDGLNFDSFSCSMSKGGSAAFPSSCGQININTITSPGVGIQISSGFLAADNSFDDAVIDYHVSSKSGISAVGLDFNGVFLGMGISSVSESIFSGNQLVGFASVSCADAALGGSCTRTDNILLNGTYNDLYIQKDINVTGLRNSSATISAIDQTFTATPEPSSMALLGSGLMGAAFLRRKFKKSTLAV